MRREGNHNEVNHGSFPYRNKETVSSTAEQKHRIASVMVLIISFTTVSQPHPNDVLG